MFNTFLTDVCTLANSILKVCRTEYAQYTSWKHKSLFDHVALSSDLPLLCFVDLLVGPQNSYWISGTKKNSWKKKKEIDFYNFSNLFIYSFLLFICLFIYLFIIFFFQYGSRKKSNLNNIIKFPSLSIIEYFLQRK